MCDAYSACVVTCWTHGRTQKMPPVKSSSSCSTPSRATTGQYRSPDGCCEWLATNVLTSCGGESGDGRCLLNWKVEQQPSRQPARGLRRLVLSSARKRGR